MEISRATALALTALLAVSVGGCTRGDAPAPTANSLTVFAAASLEGALEAAKAEYVKARPGATITISLGSSSALATQIEQGAPADVFLSADADNPRRLVDAGLAQGDPVVFARNSLIIVSPYENPGGVDSWKDLATKGLRIVAASEEVPITTYTHQVLAKLAAEPDAPTGFQEAYAANVVSREDNVKAILAKVELGEADAGIVYVTDAAASGKVTTTGIPLDANVSATYAAVAIKAAPNPNEATSFLRWLIGPEGQAVLHSFGFLPRR